MSSRLFLVLAILTLNSLYGASNPVDINQIFVTFPGCLIQIIDFQLNHLLLNKPRHMTLYSDTTPEPTVRETTLLLSLNLLYLANMILQAQATHIIPDL